MVTDKAWDFSRHKVECIAALACSVPMCRVDNDALFKCSHSSYLSTAVRPDA